MSIRLRIAIYAYTVLKIQQTTRRSFPDRHPARRKTMRLNKLALALSLAAFALPLTALAQDAAQSADPAQQTDQADQAPAAEQAAPAPAEEATEAPAEKAAEEPAPNLTWNLAVTSDYVFRGITQNNYKPALQGGLDYAFGDSGFYVGTWGSNIDFQDPDGPDLEIDTFVGFSTDVSKDWNLDFSIVRYNYIGERSAYGDVDYNEFFAKTTWNKMLTFTVAYAPNYANLDYSSVYLNLAGTWDLGHDFSLNAGVGHSNFSDNNGNYNDWNLGVSKQFGPVNAAINYYDTNLSGTHASDTIVLTLSLGS
jgi:uncharacterized protein (TIGR02001 family)